MTLILTELKKWKRNKAIWCLFILAFVMGLYAIERACSISRSSPLMDSFGDLYTLAFKNLTGLFMPISLGLIATTLFFEEQKNNTWKEILIIPLSKMQIYISKVIVIIFLSVSLCFFTFMFCVVGGAVTGNFPDFNSYTILQAAALFLTGGILIPIAMLPIVFLSIVSKSYILPIGATLLYIVPAVFAPNYLMCIHPLISAMGIYAKTSVAATEMVEHWAQGITLTATPLACAFSLMLVGAVSMVTSIVILKQRTY